MSHINNPQAPQPTQYLPAGYRSPGSTSTSSLSSGGLTDDTEFDSGSPRALAQLQEQLSVVGPIDGARGQSPVNDIGAQLMATVGPQRRTPQYLPAGYRSPGSTSTSSLSSGGLTDDTEFDSLSPRALAQLQEQLSVVGPIDGARGQSPVNDVGAAQLMATVGRRAETETTRRGRQPRRGVFRYIDSGEPLPPPISAPPQYHSSGAPGQQQQQQR